jgi:hypothetical protein
MQRERGVGPVVGGNGCEGLTGFVGVCLHESKAADTLHGAAVWSALKIKFYAKFLPVK